MKMECNHNNGNIIFTRSLKSNIEDRRFLKLPEKKVYSSFIDFANSNSTYKKYKQNFRSCWKLGSAGLRDGAIILNDIITYLRKNTWLTRKEIIKNFYIDNCDLEGISTSKINYLLSIFEPISFFNNEGGS
ncbi:MAG: hypothetical protein ACPKPY_02875 [Nitrososphaeraceae archaeon]